MKEAKSLERKYKKVKEFIYKREALESEEEVKNVFKYSRPLIHEFQRKNSDVDLRKLSNIEQENE